MKEIDKIIKVLLIEDNPDDTLLIHRMLSETKDVSFELEFTKHLATGLERLSRGNIDVVLLDLGLSDSQGPDTFTSVHDQAPEIPIIILTGSYNTSLAAMHEGAQDYLVKNQMDSNLLVRSIHYAIERKRAQKEIDKAKKAAETSTQIKFEFLSNISHEIRTPMNAILGFTELLMSQTTDEQHRDYLSSISSSGKSLLRIINDILDISKIEAGKLEIHYEAVNPYIIFVFV